MSLEALHLFNHVVVVAVISIFSRYRGLFTFKPAGLGWSARFHSFSPGIICKTLETTTDTTKNQKSLKGFNVNRNIQLPGPQP